MCKLMLACIVLKKCKEKEFIKGYKIIIIQTYIIISFISFFIATFQ